MHLLCEHCTQGEHFDVEPRKMSSVSSSLLTARENGLLSNLVGQECSVLACAVVQLCLATVAHEGQKSEWEIHSCGVVCLVQDGKLNSTFLRLFSVKRALLLWEQELYSPFKYSTPCSYFHTFASDDCQAGLNFADEEEASRFCSAVQKCISHTKVPCVLERTQSLDSVSPWLLREKLNACLATSLIRKPTPPTVDVEGTNQTSRPGTNEAKSSSSTSQSCTLPRTFSNSNASSVSLAQRKGPLPPIPSKGSVASPSCTPSADMQNPASSSIPLPPPFPAPKLMGNLAGVKKSASFSPGGNQMYMYKKN